MKYKLLLLTLCMAAVLTGCKKDNNNTPAVETTVTIKQKLVGTWLLLKAVGTSYDEAGKVTKTGEEKVEGTSNWKFLENNTVENSNAQQLRNYQYNLTNTDNKLYINLINNFTDTYEITITGASMTWTIEETSTSPTYQRVKLVYYFERK